MHAKILMHKPAQLASEFNKYQNSAQGHIYQTGN